MVLTRADGAATTVPSIWIRRVGCVTCQRQRVTLPLPVNYVYSEVWTAVMGYVQVAYCLNVLNVFGGLLEDSLAHIALHCFAPPTELLTCDGDVVLPCLRPHQRGSTRDCNGL